MAGQIKLAKQLSKTAKDAAETGIRLAELGDLIRARAYLEKAANAAPKHLPFQYNLALLCERTDDWEAAAQLYSHALRQAPDELRAASKLATICRRFTLNDPAALDPFGLAAAMKHPAVDPQQMMATTLAHLRASSSDMDDWLKGDAAGADLTSKTPAFLTKPLWLDLLTQTLIADPDAERALTSLRNAIAKLERHRFSDKALVRLTCALLQQIETNEYVFAEPDTLEAILARFPLDQDALIAGDRDQSTNFLVQALFKPSLSLLPPSLKAEELGKLRPEALRNHVQERLKDRRSEREIADQIRVETPSDDATSRQVAGRYEAFPYPRWHSVQMPEAGWLTKQLPSLLPNANTGFLDTPFTVLIAGCGTGRQACQATRGYGANATVTATDLSVTSLSYAARKAQGYGLDNLSFRQQDILDLDPAKDGPYDIIECLGVLHHMADPWLGWRKLLACLKPGGFMQIALYSSRAREDITALRQSDDFPGPQCDADTARAYRLSFLDKPDDDIGGRIKRSLDYYTLSGFRDLLLHPSEQPVSLPEIDAFLTEEGLEFGSFIIDSEWLEAFLEAHPDETVPGSLTAWDQFEAANPRLFESMYHFWVTKPAVD